MSWHVAMQSQDYGPAKWSIGQRSTGLNSKDLDDAVSTGSILRTHVLRPTWHFVTREDIRWLLALTGPRVRQSTAPRTNELGLDSSTLARGESVITSALSGGNHLTRSEISSLLEKSRLDKSGQRLPYLLMHLEIEAVICSGILRGKQQTYALLDERASELAPFDHDHALAELVRRYLTSHGPATVQDLRWWSSLKVSEIRKGLEALGSDAHEETIHGKTLWAVESNGEGPSASGAHLLQSYDEFIVGYSESRFLGDAREQAIRQAWSGRTLPASLVLINGTVAGHWRRATRNNAVTANVQLYEPARRSTLEALQIETERLSNFIAAPVKMVTTTIPNPN
ncbi:MAG TPA: winged helix DNA-binding domain-containing protein [Actinomycetota bacterium]|nr:winged helix DNA-binding domain-containing protein [Actinomycetota bacterium]